MIISIDTSHTIATKSLLVEIQYPGNSLLLDLSRESAKINLEFDLPICNQEIEIKFCCNDLRIVDYPLTIDNIVLDDFYQYNNLVYRGRPAFDQSFLLLSQRKNMFIDVNVNDSNRLDFTGHLIYSFKWPFFKNLFHKHKF
jgi:hypothetical protein